VRAIQHNKNRRNRLLCIFDGVLVQLGMNISHPSMVLAILVRTLGGSNTLVGALSAIRFSGWQLPQFPIAGWIQPLPRKAPFAVTMALARAGIYGLLAALTLTLGRTHPTLLLSVFFALFTLSRVVTSAGALARFDVWGKIFHRSKRASFFATRNFWGGVFVFGSGFLVRLILDPDKGLPFPQSFALLLAVSSAAFLIASVLFSQIQEPAEQANNIRYSVRDQLWRAPSLLRRDPYLRQYLLVRVLLSTTVISQPFYPIYALDVLQAPESMVGIYLSALTLANVIANLLWQKLERSQGTYALLRMASLLSALAPLLAATTPLLVRALGPGHSGLLPAYIFSTVFLLAGASQSGRGVSLPAVILEIAPTKERPSYIGLVNTLLGFVSFLPVLSGFAIDRLGYSPVFLTTGVILLAGFLASRRLTPRPPAGPHPAQYTGA